jgi:hypothetical protein
MRKWLALAIERSSCLSKEVITCYVSQRVLKNALRTYPIEFHVYDYTSWIFFGKINNLYQISSQKAIQKKNIFSHVIPKPLNPEGNELHRSKLRRNP